VGRLRTLAHVTGGGSKLVSRNGNASRGFPDLAAELSLEVNADDAILDGEIVKLDADGRPQRRMITSVPPSHSWPQPQRELTVPSISFPPLKILSREPQRSR
jgi:hypothetical protein